VVDRQVLNNYMKYQFSSIHGDKIIYNCVFKQKGINLTAWMIFLVRFHIPIEIHRLLLRTEVFKVRTLNTRSIEFLSVPADRIHALTTYCIIREYQEISRYTLILSGRYFLFKCNKI
jgi:hypothetical protein